MPWDKPHSFFKCYSFENELITHIGTFLVAQWLRLCAPNAGVLSSIPSQETRFHMLQLKDRYRMPQLRSGAVKQIINKSFKKYNIYIYAAKLLQSCPTLCDSTDGSPSDSPIPGILQARAREWVAISFSNAWEWKGKVKSLRLCLTPSDPMDCSPPGSSIHRIF